MAGASPEEIARGLAALRGGAGVATPGDRALVAVTGADRASFLQGMLTNEVARLAAGEGCRALLLGEQGRLVAEVRVAVGADEITLDVARDRADALRAALERLVVADDVELEPRPAGQVLLLGPRAADALAAAGVAGAAGLAALPPWSHREIAVAGRAATAVRARERGADGFHLRVADEAAARDLALRLAEAGAHPVPAEALEVGRVAAGDAVFPADWDEQTLAPEVVSLAGAISYRKGCYLGQEVVERVAARGHVNWLVVRLHADRGVPPAPGAPARCAGREVGRVSSAVALPGGGLAMIARLRREVAGTDAVVEIDGPTGPIPARVLASDGQS